MSRLPFSIPSRRSLEGMQSEFRNLIERWWHCGLDTGPLDGQDWAPPIEMREEPDHYHVFIELPGLSRAQLELSIQNRTLVVSGDKRPPSAVTNAQRPDEAEVSDVLYTERRYGGFKRHIDLPGPVQPEHVSAALTDGVLDVRLPKVPEVESGEVHVQIEAPDSGHLGFPPTG